MGKRIELHVTVWGDEADDQFDLDLENLERVLEEGVKRALLQILGPLRFEKTIIMYRRYRIVARIYVRPVFANLSEWPDIACDMEEVGRLVEEALRGTFLPTTIDLALIHPW